MSKQKKPVTGKNMPKKSTKWSKKDNIWSWDKGRYKIHCNTKQCQRLAKWKGCTRDAQYLYPNGRVEWDVIIPKRLLPRSLKVMSERK